MRFSLWLESKENFVYHATLLRNLPEIAQHGLVPNFQNSTWAGKHGHVKGKNFFSTDLSNVRFWIDKLKDIIFDRYESSASNPNNFVEEKAIPIILRFRFNQRPTTTRWLQDQESDVGKNDYYTNKIISPMSIQWWDGRSWKSVEDDNIDINLFVIRDNSVPDTDYDAEDQLRFHWEFNEKYPFPL